MQGFHLHRRELELTRFPAHCYDNAAVESLWATLKRDLNWIYGRKTWTSRALLRSAIFDYIEGFYNPQRIQKRLGYRSPAWGPWPCEADLMWVQLSNWIAGDDGLDLGVGDPWSTVLDAYSESAEVVDPSTPLCLNLADVLPFSAGPTYDIVGRTFEDETAGTCLDTGSAILNPQGYDDWPLGTVLKMRSELRGGWYPTIPPPDVLLYSGTIRQVLVRWWKAVSTGEPHSYRADPDTVQFRPIERMNSFYDGKSPDSDARVISDYLVELG